MVEIKPGKRLEIPERVNKISKNLTEPGRNVRTNIDNRLDQLPVKPANDNISTNTLTGGAITAIVWALEDYLPGRAGANTEVLDVEPVEGGMRYTINTNAPIEGQARFRAMLDSTTGITSLWTDEIEIDNFEVVKERPIRDTYRYRITVKD